MSVEVTNNPVPELRRLSELSREDLTRSDLYALVYMPTKQLVALGEMAAQQQEPPNTAILAAVGTVSLIRRLSGFDDRDSIQGTIMTAFPGYYES